jgi:transcription elongation factor GreA
MREDLGAASLLRSVGLLADGPAVWGRPVPAPGPGVFILELPHPEVVAPLDLSRIGKWIERVGSLRLDGDRPTSKALAARLASFWLPSQQVVYIGASSGSIARRISAIEQTDLGDRHPFSGGHWLKTLRSLDGLRIWWATTTAPEEYEDALLTAFADRVPATDLGGGPDRDIILPWAVLRRPTGERKPSGLTGSILPAPASAPTPPSRVVQVPDGDAEGARGEPPVRRRRATASSSRRAGPASAVTADQPQAVRADDAPVAEALTADGEARLRAELDELTQIRRPQVIARIRVAKEHGDLKENSDYHAAREEQSFLEGRVQAIEARLRSAVIVEAPAAGSKIGLGSIVTMDDDGDPVTYTIVGADDSDPAHGRISSVSPVGRALLGRGTGDEVVVRTPSGERRYRVLDIA